MERKTIKEHIFTGGQKFTVVQGNILEEKCDGIVNAANGFLVHGGGVAAAIAAAAGDKLSVESLEIVRRQGQIPVGGAVLTTAGKLPFKGVIHAIGPRQGDGQEEDKIVMALKAAFAIAAKRNWHSLSFPAVSSGIFSVPRHVCVKAYLRTVKEFFQQQAATPLKDIRLCLFPGPIIEAVQDEWENFWSDDGLIPAQENLKRKQGTASR